jgi:DNA-binding NarL/FixJ family response regulator
LAQISDPAFVVSESGAIHRANRSGRRLLSRDAVSLATSLVSAITSAGAGESWTLVPLGFPGGPLLAVMRTEPHWIPSRGSYPVARRRWNLTERQTQVLELVSRGLTNALIAEELQIKEATVEFHVTALFDKVGVSNRATLIVRLLELARA